ncbi:MAG: SNF2-related protein [Acetivibrio ethanolgignens]
MEYKIQEFKPHDYQKFAADFIMTHPISAVILFLGAGKTVITLTVIEKLMYEEFEVGKVLIIAPLRVAKVTWKDEILKWKHLRHMSYAVAVGTEKERMEALRKNADITIINRENLQWLIEKSGVSFDYDMVVIDELSSFKNWQSKRFRAFMKVRPKVKRIVGLTGTPAPNSLMDLFAEFKCLDMGERLGRFITQYRTAYFTPDKMNGQIVYSYKLLPGAEERIYEKISDITISMKALDHLKMPELISNKYPVYMDEAEEAKYQAMKNDLILPFKDEDDITAANAAALSGKLSQMANGAVYSDNGETVYIHDRKLDALEDIIEAAQGPILLCYWFKHDLERIVNRLDALKVGYSKISTEESIRKWNEGKYQVGLIHPASAGHGLNLQHGGNVIVWFGLTWSLELYDQTNARLWRQGQQASTVVVQHIVTAGTIDERILDAISKKEKGQNALIDAVKAEL